MFHNIADQSVSRSANVRHSSGFHGSTTRGHWLAVSLTTWGTQSMPKAGRSSIDQYFPLSCRVKRRTRRHWLLTCYALVPAQRKTRQRTKNDKAATPLPVPKHRYITCRIRAPSPFRLNVRYPSTLGVSPPTVSLCLRTAEVEDVQRRHQPRSNRLVPYGAEARRGMNGGAGVATRCEGTGREGYRGAVTPLDLGHLLAFLQGRHLL